MRFDTKYTLPLYDHEKREIEQLYEKRKLLLHLLSEIQAKTYPENLRESIKQAVEGMDEAQMELDKDLEKILGKHYWRIFEEEK